MAKFSELYEFIDRAEKNRNYTYEAAKGLKVALRLFETELNEDEKASVSKFKENLDKIFQAVFTKNKQFTAGSAAVYRSRVARVVGDFEKYGLDPIKLNSWASKISTRTPRVSKKREINGKDVPENEITGDASSLTPAGMHRIEFPLRPGAKCVMLVPQDMTATDVERIKKLLDTLFQ